MLTVTDFAKSGSTLSKHSSHFTGAKPQRGISAFARHQLRGSSRTAGQLRTLTWLEFNAMNNRTYRNVTQCHGVTRANSSTAATHQIVSSFDSARRNNVAPLAILVFEKCDIGRSVWIVLKSLNNRRNTVFATLEINKPVMLLMTTAAMSRGDTASVIAPTVLRLLLQ